MRRAVSVSAITNRIPAPLREAPATVLLLAAIVPLIALASDQAGYPLTHWAPDGLIVLALLALGMRGVGLRVAALPLTVRIALAALAGYTLLSFCSILWASAPGDAWEGADRTLLYLLVFALFACLRQTGRSAALLLATWLLAMIGLAVFVALHLDAVSGATLAKLFGGPRLLYPSGYVNANAALWLMAAWPALLLARSRLLWWGLRGAFAGGAVLLAELALLSQSRGSLYATAAMLLLVFALLGDRVRTFAVLAPVAAGIGAAAPAVLRVGDHLRDGEVTPTAVHAAIAAAVVAAVVAGLGVAIGAAIESRTVFSAGARRRVRYGIGAVALATLVGVVSAGWVAAGDPAARLRHAWDTFKSGRGYAANSSANRLVSGLGSNRYDFYRVALDEFAAHPLIGIGADNFQQQYLAHGRSDETPRYPHSVEMRTLAETGLAGMGLALVGLAAALAAGVRACRSSLAGSPDPLAGAVAAAALGGFAYWAVHGSFDWFWEFAGLGAPAFALLGLACALAPVTPLAAAAPPRAEARTAARGPRRPWIGGLGILAGVCLALGAAGSLAAPWLSRLEVQAAARIWPAAPRRAYARLDEAARLNPLSDEPYLVAGGIALRFGDLARADHEFSLALSRNHNGAYATLERGAIASIRGERQLALRLLRRALRLDPRNPLAREALARAQHGGRVDLQELNRSLLRKAQQLL